jgi:hypothetical protein
MPPLAEPLDYQFSPDFASSLGIPEAQARLLFSGLSPESRKGYETAIQSYEAICSIDGFQPWPATTEALANWVARRAFPSNSGLGKQLRPGTLHSYLSALRSYHVDRKIPLAVFDNNSFLQRLIRGAERLFPWQKATRRPITKDILDKIISPYTLSTAIDDININAAFALAHGGFLRMGEFTYKEESQRVLETRRLTRGDVIFAEDDSFVKIRLKQSKADKHFEGVTVLIASSPTNCPVTLLKRLITLDTAGPNQPLFRLAAGHFSYEAVTKILRQRLTAARLNASDFAGHSFRKGAAQDAINRGLQEHEVQLLGRWKSDSVKLYYKMDPYRIYALSYQHQHGKAPAFTAPTSKPPPKPLATPRASRSMALASRPPSDDL